MSAIWLLGGTVTGGVFDTAAHEASAVALDGLGHTVTRVDATTVSVAPTTADCDVVIHMTGNVAGETALRAAAVDAAPVIGLNSYYLGNVFGHSAVLSGAAGTVVSGDDITIEDVATITFTAGYVVSDVVVIAPFAIYMEQVTGPATGGVLWASSTGVAGTPSVGWAFGAGITNLAGQVTTARIATWHIFDNLGSLNAAGLQILDDLISWATVTEPAPEPPAAPVTVPTGPWSIDLCRNWQRIGIVDGYEFVGVERFNEPGEWTLSAPVAACEFGSRLVGGVPRRWKPRDVDTVRVVRGGQVEFAGYVGAGASGTGGMERTLTADGDRVTWSGPDAWDVLERRLAWPTPADVLPWADAYDVRSGQASAVLASYLIYNIGREAREFRQWPGFVVADHGVGDDGEWSARLQTLAALATRIASEGGVRCRVSVRFAGEVRVDIDAPVDRSAELTLSDQGDLTSATVRRVPRSASMVIAGGQGELADRQFVSVQAAFNVLDARREVFSDQSSLATVSELTASAEATLAAAAESWSVNAEASDEASLMLAAIASDARPGDLIGLQVDGERHVVPITARRFELSAERQVVVPVLGTAAPDELASLQRDVGGLAGRLDSAIT